MTDKLEDIFRRQKDLNDIIASHRLPNALKGTKPEKLLAVAGALLHETVEFRDECNWKWWKRYEEPDPAKLREEFADIVHFVIILAVELGISPDDMYRDYIRKNNINKERAAALK